MIRFALAALSVAAAPVQAAPAPAPPVEVMVLGTYHFGNPGLDLNNIKADSVLTSQRQAELARLAAKLAEFRPTHVMVEKESSAPDLAVADYQRFDDAMLAREANETVQIGYRTARLAGLARVNGIDEQPGEGEPDYFPFGKVQEAAARFGQAPVVEKANVAVAEAVKSFDAAQKTSTVGQLLQRMNVPGTALSGMDSYYAILGVGDRDAQPGADLNAMWYLRNAKIFGKLMHIAKPGDRVLVVYGSGHGFWLRHFASLTPGFRNVDVMPFLKRAR